mgnify:CR=1 FL=1
MDFEMQGEILQTLKRIADELESIDASLTKYGHELCVQGREIPSDVSRHLDGISYSLGSIAENTK